MKIIRSLDSNLTSQQIGEIIGQDQGVTAQILRLANSSFFGFKGQVGTLDKAINILGIKMVRNVVMSSSLISHTKQLNLWNINISNFWLHTFLVAEFSKELAHLVKINPDEAYVAGLLHDIGKLIIYSQKQEKSKLFTTPHSTHDILNYEKIICNYPSHEVSEMLLSKWNIPKSIIAGIRHHHDPEYSHPLSNVILIANEFSNIVTDQNYKSSLTIPAFKSILSRINLNQSRFNNYAARLPEMTRRGEQMLESISKNPPEFKRRKLSKGATLVSADENPLSKSILEMLGYKVDILHPKTIEEQEKMQQKKLNEEIEDEDIEPFNPTDTGTKILRFLNKFNPKNKINDGELDNKNVKGSNISETEEIPLEPIRWQFLVIFDKILPVKLPVGRKCYTINYNNTESEKNKLPFFFSASDLRELA